MPEHQPYSFANEHAPYEQFPPFTKKQAEEIEHIAGEGKSDVSSVNGKTGAITGVLFNEAETVPVSVLKKEELTSTQIKSEGIKSASYEKESITAAAIKKETITAENLASESVASGKIKEFAVTTTKLANENVTTLKLANECVTEAKLKKEIFNNANFNTYFAVEAITGGAYKKESITGEKLVNGTITPKQLQGGAAPAYSGKVEITKNKEEEASATERKFVSVTCETKKTEETVIEILVNKVFVAKSSVGAAIITNSFVDFQFIVPAAQKYEVKQVAGTIEKVFASAVTI